MRTLQKLLIASGLSLLLPFAASAQSLSDIQNMNPEDRRAYMEAMSGDERTAMRDKWRSEYDALPEEEKRAVREKRNGARGDRNGGRDREAMRERRESMTDEERAVAKERRQSQSAERKQRWESMNEEERAAAKEKRGKNKGEGADRQHRKRENGGERRQRSET